MVKVCVAALAGLGLLAMAGGAAAADAASGRRIAERWCASCHVVSPGQTRGTAAVATFQEIARRSEMSEAALSRFLADPHPKMPDMQLGRTEISDLVAYIRAQR